MAHVKTSRHLLPSNNVAVTAISKTYVQRGTVQLGAFIALYPSQSSFPERATVAPGDKRDKEHLMLDVVMLALGLGFFLSTPQPDPGFFRATKAGRCSDIQRICACGGPVQASYPAT